MKPNITQPLEKIDPSQDQIVNIDDLNQKYGRDKVDEAVRYLTYRNVEELPKSDSGEGSTLYVFRHGQTDDNANMLFSGWRDSGLTQTGIDQAKQLADKLANKKIQMLIASDQVRAIDTMKYAIEKNEYAKDLEITPDRRIRERCYGDWQGKSKLIMQLEDPKGLYKVRRGYNNPPPNGESLKDTVKRVGEFLDEIIPLMKGQSINVAISCHGNSIRGIRQYFEKLNDEETSTIETPLGKDYAAYRIS